MILRISLTLLFSIHLAGCATAQMYEITATVQQPAGSVVVPAAEPDMVELSEEDLQPLYSREDVLLYLPAPANLASYTISGKTVDVIILGPRLSKGLSFELLPVGLMEFAVSDRVQRKVIAIPSDPSLQTIKSPSLEQLRMNYPGVLEILTTWFENAYGDQQIKLTAIKNEREAVQYLENLP